MSIRNDVRRWFSRRWKSIKKWYNDSQLYHDWNRINNQLQVVADKWKGSKCTRYLPFTPVTEYQKNENPQIDKGELEGIILSELLQQKSPPVFINGLKGCCVRQSLISAIAHCYWIKSGKIEGRDTVNWSKAEELFDNYLETYVVYFDGNQLHVGIKHHHRAEPIKETISCCPIER